MVVGRDVLNQNGTVLLAVGTTLTSQMLNSLKWWGIDAIHIDQPALEAQERETVPDLPPDLLKAAEAHVDRRFKHVPTSNPGVEPVREMAVRRVAAAMNKTPVRKPEPQA
jgi:hypothetical protein